MGCLVPQDYRFSDDVPPLKNNQLEIIAVSPAGSSTIPTQNGLPPGTGLGCSLNFSVTVADADVDDSITVRWYVDYDPSPGSQTSGFVSAKTLVNRGTALRDPADWTTNLNQPGNLLQVEGTHVVEAVAFDGQLSEPDRTPIAKSVSDAGVNPSFVQKYVWIVKTEPGDCQ
jgi:hypothetical protein